MTFKDIIGIIIDNLNLAVWFIIALSLFVFFYGIVIYIAQSGDESKRKEGSQYIRYGLIGMFVMISVWGLVGLLAGLLGTGVEIPQF